MAGGKGLGLIALLGLVLFLSPRKAAGIQPVGWHRQIIRERIVNGELPHQVIIRERGITMPPHIVYPQVTAETRLPPDTPDYERELEKKYPVLLPATRERYAKARKALGLRAYVAPPMPIITGGVRPVSGRITR